MTRIGILADYLTEKHKEQILTAAEAEAAEAAAASVSGASASGAFACEVVFLKDQDDFKAQADTFEVLYGYFSPELLKTATHLKYLAGAASGVDKLVAPGVLPPGARLTHSNQSYGITISEHILMMLLMLYRREPEYMALASAHDWHALGSIRSIYGSRFYIVGTGNIGTNTAQRLKALGAAHVTGVKRTPGAADAAFDRVITTGELAETLQNDAAGPDALILCVPETADTKGLITAEIMDLLPSTCVIINVGRGTVLDQEALMNRLNDGRLAGAALDVVVPEPLPAGHPLWETKNLLITPHISGNMSLSHTVDLNIDLFCRNLRHYFNNEPLEHEVDLKKGY